jgi:hypothetical protein
MIVASPGRARRRTCACSPTSPPWLDPGQAADIVWATNATELYQLLVGQCGWTSRRYQDFLTDTWQRLLLADLGRPVPLPGRIPCARQAERWSGRGPASACQRLGMMRYFDPVACRA